LGYLLGWVIEALENRQFKAATSVLTLTELLVYPLRDKRYRLIDAYHDFFLNFITIIDASLSIAEKAAQLRADHNLQTPDAIQIAIALNQKADFFLTNDTNVPFCHGKTAKRNEVER
jgi:predicted nucleic acid-binding protein